MPTHSSQTHLLVAQKSQHTTKTSQRVCLPKRTGRQKKCSKLKEKMTEMNQHQAVTMCINHWADSASFKGVTFNKLCSGLTEKCFEMPNASYTNRYGQLKNTTVNNINKN